jgi:uncharacterized protein (DUF2147 family)
VLVLALTAAAALAQQPKAPPAPPPQPPLIAEPTPVGVWIDHTGRGAVEIAPCAQELCGRIIWLQQPNDKQGRPLRDGLNAEKAKRNRAICGLQIIGGLKRQRDGSWDNGWIYDPEQGESFDVEIRLRGPDSLQVKGYKGLKFLSETFQWTRAPNPPQPRCPAA